MATDRYDLQLITPQTKLIFEGNNLVGIQNPKAKGADLIPSSSGGGAWGGITGTLADQTDLVSALAAVNGIDSSLSAAGLASAASGGTLTANKLYSPSDASPRKVYFSTSTSTLLELTNPILDATTVENMSGAAPLALRQAVKYTTPCEMDIWSATYPITTVAATYTSITASSNAAKLRLSSAGASGVTATSSPRIWVKCSGDATKNGFYTITAVSGSGPYVIDLDFNCADASAAAALGTVTVGMTSDEIPLRNVLTTGGLIGPNGRYTIRPTLSFSSTSTKILRYYLGGTYTNAILTGGTMLSKGEFSTGSNAAGMGIIQNDGSQSIQVGANINNSGTVAENTGTLDTATSLNLTLTIQIGTAGERVRLSHVVEALYGA